MAFDAFTSPIPAPENPRRLETLPFLVVHSRDPLGSPFALSKDEPDAFTLAFDAMRGDIPRLSNDLDEWDAAMACSRSALSRSREVSSEGLCVAARLLALRDNQPAAGIQHLIEALAVCRSAGFDIAFRATIPEMIDRLDDLAPIRAGYAHLSEWHTAALFVGLFAPFVHPSILATDFAHAMTGLGVAGMRLRNSSIGYTLHAVSRALAESVAPKRRQPSASPTDDEHLHLRFAFDGPTFDPPRDVTTVLLRLFEASGVPATPNARAACVEAILAHSFTQASSPSNRDGPPRSDPTAHRIVSPAPIQSMRSDFLRFEAALAADTLLPADSRSELALLLADHAAGACVKPTLFVGEPGVGKSHLVRLLSEIAGRTALRIDASALVENGFSGLHLSDALQRLGANANMRVPDLETAVIFLDEVDKLAVSVDADIVHRTKRSGAQYSLLQLLGGVGTIDIANGLQLRVERMQVFCAGAFTSLRPYNDLTANTLVDFGFIPELADRLQRVIALPPLTVYGRTQLLRRHLASDSHNMRQRAYAGLSLSLADATITALARTSADNDWSVRRMLAEADRLLTRCMIRALTSGTSDLLVVPDDLDWTLACD